MWGQPPRLSSRAQRGVGSASTAGTNHFVLTLQTQSLQNASYVGTSGAPH
jgi:hypothetical protein